MARLTLEERFWAKVEKSDGCWLWLGTKNEKGYGYFSIGGNLRRAHRVAYTLEVGPIPRGAEIMHSCDTRACVRPDHLVPGSHFENMGDAAAKGRMGRARGTRNGSARLTPDDVVCIRERYATGLVTQKVLAAEFGVSQSQISNVIQRVHWS